MRKKMVVCYLLLGFFVFGKVATGAVYADDDLIIIEDIEEKPVIGCTILAERDLEKWDTDAVVLSVMVEEEDTWEDKVEEDKVEKVKTVEEKTEDFEEFPEKHGLAKVRLETSGEVILLDKDWEDGGLYTYSTEVFIEEEDLESESSELILEATDHDGNRTQIRRRLIRDDETIQLAEPEETETEEVVPEETETEATVPGETERVTEIPRKTEAILPTLPELSETAPLDLKKPMIRKLQKLDGLYFEEFKLPMSLKVMPEEQPLITATYQLDGGFFDEKETVVEPGLHVLRGIFTDASDNTEEKQISFVVKPKETKDTKETNLAVGKRIVNEKKTDSREFHSEVLIWLLVPLFGVITCSVGISFLKGIERNGEQ